MVLDGSTMVFYRIQNSWHFKEYHDITIVSLLKKKKQLKLAQGCLFAGLRWFAQSKPTPMKTIRLNHSHQGKPNHTKLL